MMKKILFVGTFIIIGLIILMNIINEFFYVNEYDREMKRFSKHFSIALPEDTSIVFTKDTHGALGDGERLTIYQLSEEGYASIIPLIDSWRRLPISRDIQEILKKRIDGFDNEISNKISLKLQVGYWMLLDRYGGTLGPKYGNKRFRNISLAIVDSKKKQVYLYLMDM